MPKEDRSNWVAVAPQFSQEGSSSESAQIKPAQSAFTFWQKENTEQVKAEHIASNGKFEVGLFSRAMRDRWNSLDASEKEPYEDLARRDQFRFRSESHQADVAAMERRERLQKERATLLLDDVGGTQRGTRGQRAHKERKEKRKEKKRLKKLMKTKETGEDMEGDDVNDDDEYVDEHESNEDDYSDSSNSSDSDGNYRPKKKKKASPRKASAKQLENRRLAQNEKRRKEAIIAEQQEDIQKEKAAQAKKRLEFLLKQSSIFSHFGQVKEDQAKFGIKTGAKKKNEERQGSLNRRDQGNANQEEELEEADEHQATFLTSQPTTLGFGKMREYQLEGLNWMIRLQENGVNGILADEVSYGDWGFLSSTSMRETTLYCRLFLTLKSFSTRLLELSTFMNQMGLGKTLQSISVLVYMMEYQNVNGPHLIIVPKSTLSNWMNELARWAPTLKAVKFHGDKASREEMIENVLRPGRKDSDRDWNVVVTTYEICNIEKNTFMKFAWSYLIIDEAHR
jgi:SWI/SNF-related matrix-associated actin-dependent regulator of chromatin subfamily A member 5